jgi:hypothetical protein
VNNWRLEKRKARLKLVSDQLQFLYGPLFALVNAGGRAVHSLTHGEQYFFKPEECYTATQIEEYRLWMTHVFGPINEKLEGTIVGNSHLIAGERMPPEFSDVLAHIATYRAVLKRWESSPPRDATFEEAIQQNTAMIPFPQAFNCYVERTFEKLKLQQNKLLGKDKPSVLQRFRRAVVSRLRALGSVARHALRSASRRKRSTLPESQR